MAGEGTQVEVHSSNGLNVIESEEQLNEYLKGSTALPGDETAGKNGKSKASAKEDENEEEGAKGKDKDKKPVITDPTHPDYKLPEEDEEEEEEEDEDEEFTNVVDYLDKEFNLGLNLEELPKDMTREQEAEAISTIFRRVDNGIKSKLAEYEELNALLKDKEVVQFLQLKKEGKTLKDIAATYASAPEGAPDDVVVTRHLKVMFPNLTDAEIAEQVQSFREKNKLEKMATSAREYFKTQKTSEETAAEKKKQVQEEKDEQEYQESVREFGTFLQNTSKVYGIPVSPEMKKAVFKAVTTRDNEGMTYHDRVLQSNAGTFLSALGVMYMKDLLRKGAAGKASKAKLDFEDRLFREPDKLRSGSEATHEPEFNAAIANQF